MKRLGEFHETPFSEKVMRVIMIFCFISAGLLLALVLSRCSSKIVCPEDCSCSESGEVVWCDYFSELTQPRKAK